MNVNSVVVTGNLTRDPELRTTGSGTSVCSLRVAVNESVKRDGEWTDRANYFDVTVWGKQGENAAEYLSKGRPVAIQGRLSWREWEQNGNKRQAVEIVADRVQFLNAKGDDGGSSRDSDVGWDQADFEPARGSAAEDDDIPF